MTRRVAVLAAAAITFGLAYAAALAALVNELLDRCEHRHPAGHR